MSLSTLSSTFSVGVNWNATRSVTGDDYTGITNDENITKRLSVGTAAANSAAGGGDAVVSYIESIAGGGSTTLDLTSLTDVAGQSVSLARVKAILIRLLSTDDDPTNGTAATSVTVGNSGTNDFTSQSESGFFENATDEFVIPNGGFMAFGTPSAGGVAVDATHKSLKILNNDASVTAKVQITIIGGDT